MAAGRYRLYTSTGYTGSILSPSNQSMLVGIRPTVDRVSSYGLILITADQDPPEPIANTVTDAAIMLGALEGEGQIQTIRLRLRFAGNRV